jgi:hypothetical protein
MPSKSPSKFMSLTYLAYLRDNDYCHKERQIDYDPTEVEALYLSKTEKILNAKLKIHLKQEKELALKLSLTRKIKVCSYCKQEKTFKSFSPDKSKKDGKRSHCRVCRRLHYFLRR